MTSLCFSRQNTHGRRFACTIAAHKTDAIPGLDAQMVSRCCQKCSCANANVKILGGNHKPAVYRVEPALFTPPTMALPLGELLSDLREAPSLVISRSSFDAALTIQ